MIFRAWSTKLWFFRTCALTSSVLITKFESIKKDSPRYSTSVHFSFSSSRPINPLLIADSAYQLFSCDIIFDNILKKSIDSFGSSRLHNWTKLSMEGHLLIAAIGNTSTISSTKKSSIEVRLYAILTMSSLTVSSICWLPIKLLRSINDILVLTEWLY